MGKRSNFERRPRDYYPTPYKAVVPLLKHLASKSTFIEPCAGDGRLVDHLEQHGHKCNYASDIEPQAEWIERKDMLMFNPMYPSADYFITNPPWEAEVLHKMIEFMRQELPTWLLFNAGWKHTQQAIPYLRYCQKIVNVGRVKWIEDSKHDGMDDCCWYLFGDQITQPKYFFE